nr:MaoC family dehydratase [Microbacterium sp. NIBRBAC000506063]
MTETDNLLFTALSMNPAPLHLNAEYAKTTPYGRQLVTSVFTMGLIMGLSVSDLFEGTSYGNLGFDKITFPNPVFIGDTLRAETEIVSKRESRSRPRRASSSSSIAATTSATSSSSRCIERACR